MHNKIDIDTGGLFMGVKSIFKELSGMSIKRVEAKQTHRIPKVDADGKTQVDEITIEVIVERE